MKTPKFNRLIFVFLIGFAFTFLVACTTDAEDDKLYEQIADGGNDDEDHANWVQH